MKGLFKTTNYFRNYWKQRVINWHESYFNIDHPHRQKIIEILKRFDFWSILEIGCGAGANLYLVKQSFPRVDIGGIDWNADAIEEAKKMLPRASILQVGEATDIYISDKGADIILSDMCLIYLTKKNFYKVLEEARRVARVGMVFCEFHHKSWFRRQILRWTSGYNSYNYKKELKKAGFYDIQMYKLTEQDWPGGNPQRDYGWIISAKV